MRVLLCIHVKSPSSAQRRGCGYSWDRKDSVFSSPQTCIDVPATAPLHPAGQGRPRTSSSILWGLVLCSRLGPQRNRDPSLYHIDPKGSGELGVEFLTWVDAVGGEERHIQAPILEERNRLPQDPVGAEGGEGATADWPHHPSHLGVLRATGQGLITSRGRSEQPHRSIVLGDPKPHRPSGPTISLI